MRALVSLASEQGYRCVVLNHLGVLPHVKVTSPRVFRYGKYLFYQVIELVFMFIASLSQLTLNSINNLIVLLVYSQNTLYFLSGEMSSNI